MSLAACGVPEGEGEDEWAWWEVKLSLRELGGLPLPPLHRLEYRPRLGCVRASANICAGMRVLP